MNIIYILAAFVVGILFGTIIETGIDANQIRQQAEELRKLRGLNHIYRNELAKFRKPEEIEILTIPQADRTYHKPF